jgi:hypothetical protein
MRGSIADVEKGSVVSDAAPVDAAPEPPPVELTTEPEPRLLVTTVVVVPVTVELEVPSGGFVAVAAVTVTAVDEIVANGCGVARTDGVAPLAVEPLVTFVVVVEFAAAEGDGAALAVDEPLVSGGDVAAVSEPELDELELEPELETPELDVEEPDAPAPDSVAADELVELPSPLESDSA